MAGDLRTSAYRAGTRSRNSGARVLNRTFAAPILNIQMQLPHQPSSLQQFLSFALIIYHTKETKDKHFAIRAKQLAKIGARAPGRTSTIHMMLHSYRKSTRLRNQPDQFCQSYRRAARSRPMNATTTPITSPIKFT